MKTFIIFDLEATCWEENASYTRKDSEIIEIGAVRVDKETGEIVNKYQRFVRPYFHPILSDYCINLTSITQQEVLDADEFPIVIPDFNNWILDSDEYIMSWGFYDKNQIIRESEIKRLDIGSLKDKLIQKHLNMKNQFSHIYNIRHCGLSKALRSLNLKFEGTQHRGIDDAINMALVYKEIKDKFFGKIYLHD